MECTAGKDNGLKKRFEGCSQAVFLIVITALLLNTTAVFAGGGGTIDGRTLVWKGQINPRVHYEETSYSQGTIMATLDGEAIYLRSYGWSPGWLVIERTGVQCSFPVYDGDGFTAYDADGRLTHWNTKGTPTPMAQLTFKNPVRPEVRPDGLLNFGGDDQIVIQTPSPTNPNGVQTINLGKKKLLSFTSTPEGIYFVAKDNGKKPELFLAQLRNRGYRVTETGMQAEQAVYGAQRLYLVDKWGLTSWQMLNGKLVRDAIISATASPYVLCGGDDQYTYYLDGYSGVSVVGVPPDGKG